MRNRSYVIGWLFLALASLGWGQGPSCNTTTYWCGPYPLTGSADLNNLAFFTTDESSQNQNSWGMTANDILVTNQTPIPDVVPNGGIGQDQYLEAASKYVQAYERSTAGLPVFSKTLEGSPAPQPASFLWAQNLTDDCGRGKYLQPDITAAHDPGNSVWVVTTTSNILDQNNNPTDSFVCIAVSLGEDLLNKDGDFKSYWNGYAFDLSSLLPTHNNIPDIADYARFGTFGGPTNGSYYITFDLINQNPPTGSYGLEGFGVCQIPQAQLQGGGTNSPTATCYRYVVPASQLTSHPSLIHTLLPADADSNSFPSNTAGEYFLATENPNPNNGDTSEYLAFWTWNMITHLDAEVDINVGRAPPAVRGWMARTLVRGASMLPWS